MLVAMDPQSLADEAEPREGDDFYYEGPYRVWTAGYLRRRGFCCQSGCRHCPYGFKDAKAAEGG